MKKTKITFSIPVVLPTVHVKTQKEINNDRLYNR